MGKGISRQSIITIMPKEFTQSSTDSPICSSGFEFVSSGRSLVLHSTTSAGIKSWLEFHGTMHCTSYAAKIKRFLNFFRVEAGLRRGTWSEEKISKNFALSPATTQSVFGYLKN